MADDAELSFRERWYTTICTSIGYYLFGAPLQLSNDEPLSDTLTWFGFGLLLMVATALLDTCFFAPDRRKLKRILKR